MPKDTPLADRMRPTTLAQFVGQEHLTGAGKILQSMVQTKQISSMILWGPPGSGKTSLARIIANSIDSCFVQLSATTAGVKEINTIAAQAQEANETLLGKRTILFIDEIHRFNKAQQDRLLPHVEDGTITLIGATTENPSFEIISPLLSRTRVLVLTPLEPYHLVSILKRALGDKERGLGSLSITIDAPTLDLIAELSNGDARTALNALELAVQLAQTPHDSKKITISKTIVKEAFQHNRLWYDRAGEEHFNTISAFIKSMRAGDTNATIYYLARMVRSGEDPKFIARRMVVFASEDIGLANPTALVVANSVFRACETIGYPECAINLVHGAIYLARCPKDRAAYNALRQAQRDVERYGNLPIPFEIRNAPTPLMKELGFGKNYTAYPKDKSYLPEKIQKRKYL